MARTAGILTTSTTNFRHNEQRLLEAGFVWGGRSDIRCNRLGKLDIYRDAEGHKIPHARVVLGIRIYVSGAGTRIMIPFFASGKKAWKAVPSTKMFPSTDALAAIDFVLTDGKFVFDNKCPLNKKNDSVEEMLARYRAAYPEIQKVWANKLENKVKSYKLNARTCAESIDFYEIAKTLTRHNPIAFLKNGTERGFVLVHKQLLRQAYFKGSGDALPECTSKGGLPVNKMQYGDAWAFYLVHPSEIPEWLKWAKEARAGAWKEDKATYEVSFPTI